MKMLICHTTGCLASGAPVMWDDAAQQLILQQMRDEDAANGVTHEYILATPWCGACSTEYSDVRDAGSGQ